MLHHCRFLETRCRWSFNCIFVFYCQGRDLTIAYICVAFTYIFVAVVFYSCFPLQKNCIEDVRYMKFSCSFQFFCGPVWARGNPPYPVTSPPSYLSFTIFSFFPFLIHASSIFLLFIPSHYTRIVPLRFHARMS